MLQSLRWREMQEENGPEEEGRKNMLKAAEKRPDMYEDIKKAWKWIEDADAVLIGASNGLSITEGLHLFADNQAFEELFGDLKRKYGLRCILQVMGARWPTEEED